VKYGFTRIVARIDILVGVIVMLLGIALATIMLVAFPQLAPTLLGPRAPQKDDPAARAVIALGLFLAGIGLGAVFIVGGQLLLAFLDIRSRLVRIDRRLRRNEELSTERELPAADDRRRRL
jgi:hypothetical protein